MIYRSGDETIWVTVDSEKDTSVVLESVTAFFVGGKVEGFHTILAFFSFEPHAKYSAMKGVREKCGI